MYGVAQSLLINLVKAINRNYLTYMYIIITLFPGLDYCSTESFHPHCPDGSAVVVTAARYGRMRLGRCVRVDFGFIGCSSDVIQILDRLCSGRTECKLRVPDAELDTLKPCLGDLTRYLEASYECVAGNTLQNVERLLNLIILV